MVDKNDVLHLRYVSEGILGWAGGNLKTEH